MARVELNSPMDNTQHAEKQGSELIVNQLYDARFSSACTNVLFHIDFDGPLADTQTARDHPAEVWAVCMHSSLHVRPLWYGSQYPHIGSGKIDMEHTISCRRNISATEKLKASCVSGSGLSRLLSSYIRYDKYRSAWLTKTKCLAKK
jgi:hypothetical protein